MRERRLMLGLAQQQLAEPERVTCQQAHKYFVSHLHGQLFRADVKTVRVIRADIRRFGTALVFGVAVVVGATMPAWAQGGTQRVSVSSAGRQGNGSSGGPAISPNGRFVAFYSDASNLVAGDTNQKSDAFIRDVQKGKTQRVSVSSVGEQGNGNSYSQALSVDGRYVGFYSDATNLVPGDTNNVQDVFVRDRQTGTTQRVSVSSAGEQGNNTSISRRFRRTGALSPFTRVPPTWCRAAPTAHPCVRPRPPGRYDPTGQRQLERRAG